MSSIKERDSKVIWHPYTPMKYWPEAIGIVRGKGVYLIDEDGNEYIDAISSWWVNLHGHSHPYIAEKLGQQLKILEHCIFAGFTHEPAVELAERLLDILPGRMKKIFYSDNGSTAIEVAIKMALQYWTNKNEPKKKIIAIDGAYHGDTFGAMSVSARSMFTTPFNDYLFDVDFIPFPENNGNESISVLESLLQTGDVAAFVVEPLVQGTAGMRMYSETVLEQYFELCKKHKVLVIADEVMTGFGRTGSLFACDTISQNPDIICLSKGLTGGTMAMGITACTQEIFDAFYDDRSKTLYHGHSYTANPLACTAALASLDLLLADPCKQQRELIVRKHKNFADAICENEAVKEVRYKGTILAIELRTGEETSYNNTQRDTIYKFFLERNILLRPLGNIIYFMPPYCITEEELEYVYDKIHELTNTLTRK